MVCLAHKHRVDRTILVAAIMSAGSLPGRFLAAFVAKNGTGHFWGQRLSAIALAFLGLWFAWCLTTMSALAYADAVEFIAAPTNRILLLLLCGALGYHSYLGVEVVIDDYVHGTRIRPVSHNLSRFAHVVIGVVAMVSIMQTGPGA